MYDNVISHVGLIHVTMQTQWRFNTSLINQLSNAIGEILDHVQSTSISQYVQYDPLSCDKQHLEPVGRPCCSCAGHRATERSSAWDCSLFQPTLQLPACQPAWEMCIAHQSVLWWQGCHGARLSNLVTCQSWVKGLLNTTKIFFLKYIKNRKVLLAFYGLILGCNFILKVNNLCSFLW